MRKRIWIACGVLLAAGAWLDQREERGNAEVQREVMAAVRVNGRASSLAGVSARGRVAVKALSPRRIGADTATAEYHRYMNRCMACHEAPAPSLHARGEWPAVVQRMDANMRAAGTLGLRGDDHEAVLRFLERHAR